jgi:hypothetical protein
MEPGGANIILQYDKIDTLNGPELVEEEEPPESSWDKYNELEILVYKDSVLQPTLGLLHKGLIVDKLYELEKYDDILVAKDLVVVELRDFRLIWNKFSDYLQLTTEDQDIVPLSTGMIRYLIDFLPVPNSSYLDATVNPFYPENSTETVYSHTLPISASVKHLLEYTLNKTENSLIIGEDAKVYVDPYSEYDPETFFTEFKYAKPCLEESRTLAEFELKYARDSPYKYNFYFTPNEINSKFDYTYLFPSLRGGDTSVLTGTHFNFFPLTYECTEGDRVAIAFAYKSEVETYLTKEDFVHVYAGIYGSMCLSSLRKSWTSVKIVCNPYGVYTHVYGFRRDNMGRYEYEENEMGSASGGTIWVQGDTTEAVTENTEEFTINVTDQSFNDDLIGTQQIVVNPLNNNSEDTHGYVLKVGDYVTAVKMRPDSDDVVKFLCIDGPCNTEEYDTGNPPTAITLSNNEVDENSPGAAIGNLTVTDEDLPDDTHTLEIIGDDRGLEIVNDILKVKGDAGVDSADSPLVVDILATDDGGRKYQETFLITVNSTPTSARFALDTVSIVVSTGTQRTGIQTAAFYNNDENSIPNNFNWRVTPRQKMDTNDTVTFTVKNYGDGSLDVSAISLSGDLFSSVLPTTSTISAGASQAFVVTCLSSVSPLLDISYSGSITFTHDGDEFGMNSPFIYSIDHYGYDPVTVVLGGANDFSANQNGGGGTSTVSIDGNALEGSVIEYTESTGESAGYASLSGLTDGETYDVYVRYRVSSSGTQGYKFTNSTTYAGGSWTTFSDMPTAYTGLGDSFDGNEFEKILTGYVHNATNDPYMWVTSGTNSSHSVYLDRIVFVQLP